MWTLHRTVKQTLWQGGWRSMPSRFFLFDFKTFLPFWCSASIASYWSHWFSMFDNFSFLQFTILRYCNSFTLSYFWPVSQWWDVLTRDDTWWHVMTRDETCPDKVTRTVRTAMWVQMSDWVIYCLVKVNPLLRAACQAPSAFSLSCSACSELRERGRYLLSDGSNMTSSFALWRKQSPRAECTALASAHLHSAHSTKLYARAVRMKAVFSSNICCQNVRSQIAMLVWPCALVPTPLS